MQNLWRPAMGWMYMIICFCDMIVFPVLWSLLQAFQHQQITQWDPLTLRGAGLFHIAMGAVLGIAAFGRTQEKLAGTAINPMASVQTTNNNMTGNVAGGFGSNSGGMGNGGFGGNSGGFGGSSGFGGAASGGFGSSSGFGSSTPAPSSASGGFGSSSPASGFGATNTTTAPAVSSKGLKMIPPADQPAL